MLFLSSRSSSACSATTALSSMPFAGCTADVLHDPLRRRFRMHGFLSHLHSLMVTMSQKSFVPQADKSVSQVLMSDTIGSRPRIQPQIVFSSQLYLRFPGDISYKTKISIDFITNL